MTVQADKAKLVDVKAGKATFKFHVDPIRIPSRGAKLSTRARWAVNYVARLADGEPCTKRNLNLAVRWIHELKEAYAATLAVATLAGASSSQVTF